MTRFHSKRNHFGLALVCALSVSTTREAAAWEAPTTHAGLSEQSALHSSLHRFIRNVMGFNEGLYASLQVPAEDAPELFEILRNHSPIHGYVPDSRGRMTALSWLVAGAVVADVPVEEASNHFFDPTTKKPLTSSQGLLRNIKFGLLRSGHETLETGRESAFNYWRSKDNPMGYYAFVSQYELALTAPSRPERERHLAGALLSAGSMLHILQDMGSPSHVRNDLAAHQEVIGTDFRDRGSRFERIAALAFGRLGIPGPPREQSLEVNSLAELFSNASGLGLADITASSYFSTHTLPAVVRLYRGEGGAVFRTRLKDSRRRAKPEAPNLDVFAARNAKGAMWVSKSGVCLARYQWSMARVRFWIDDDCALEQLEEILPRVTNYGKVFLNTLIASPLTLQAQGTSFVLTSSQVLPAASLTAYFDSDTGERSSFHTSSLPKGTSSISIPAAPRAAKHITVVVKIRGQEGQLFATGLALQ